MTGRTDQSTKGRLEKAHLIFLYFMALRDMIDLFHRPVELLRFFDKDPPLLLPSHSSTRTTYNHGDTSIIRQPQAVVQNSLLRAIAYILYGGPHSEMKYTIEPSRLAGASNLRPDLLVETRTAVPGTLTNPVAVDVTFTSPVYRI